jgi:hypothetical protein
MILPRHRKDWPKKFQELFEERAGIMQFAGNVEQDKAEQEAEDDIRDQAKQERGAR